MYQLPGIRRHSFGKTIPTLVIETFFSSEILAIVLTTSTLLSTICQCGEDNIKIQDYKINTLSRTCQNSSFSKVKATLATETSSTVLFHDDFDNDDIKPCC
jgi:hypothetical protein